MNITSSIKSTIRNISRRIQMSFASEKKVRNAFSKVRCELRKMGLLSEGKPLDQISCRSVVHLSGLVGVMGFYTWGSNVITIPSVFPAALSPYLSGRSLINVFRHEFGHALADKYKRYVNSTKFKKAFGGNAFDTTCIAADHYVDEYVSNYAQQCPQEDFAETFMVYIKNKGIFPREYNGVEALYSKWQVIDDICKKIARGKNEHPSRHEAGNQPSA